ncbi:MAG: gfo/Idh/MocA family oxidoreductase [Planctomycetes bacterium]|nr:gfo/Idh/MocA family oxidoreductase [Planctomycetota bacterium]
MRRRDTGRWAAVGRAILAWSAIGAVAAAEEKGMRVGIIGLDTSHATAFTKLLNTPDDPQHVPGGRVVVACPRGSADIGSSVKRIPEYTATVRGLGVEIIDDVAAVVERCDAVLLETNDGRPHLEQALPVIRAGKRLFIDKPVAGSLADAVAIYRAAGRAGVPVFSASALRFGTASQAVRGGLIGAVTGCDTFSPCSLEATHPRLFWYGIHGCESLFTVMGRGCQTVVGVHSADHDAATGLWDDGRIGTFRGIRRGSAGYGGTAFGMKGSTPVGAFDGYRPLLVAIMEFFASGVPPVDPAETLELYAFMAAAERSAAEGRAVRIADVLAEAEAAATARLEALGAGPR